MVTAEIETIAVIPEVRETHNALVELVGGEGFSVPEPNESTGFRVGHVLVPNPKPNHPTSYGGTVTRPFARGDCPLPVAVVLYGFLKLVNTNHPELREYHEKLRRAVQGFFERGS